MDELIPGAPLLGATETVKGTLSGLTFGLPISEVVTYIFYILEVRTLLKVIPF